MPEERWRLPGVPERGGWWRCEAKRAVGCWRQRRLLLGRRRDVGVDEEREARRKARWARVRGSMFVCEV